MVAAPEPSSSPGETLEESNPYIAAVGQFLCVAVPLIIWFAPLNLEAQTQHAFAIVAFMVVAWITQAMDYALAGLVGCFLFWALGIVRLMRWCMDEGHTDRDTAE
jgi:di/tricarboxylate transporter